MIMAWGSVAGLCKCVPRLWPRPDRGIMGDQAGAAMQGSAEVDTCCQVTSVAQKHPGGTCSMPGQSSKPACAPIQPPCKAEPLLSAHFTDEETEAQSQGVGESGLSPGPSALSYTTSALLRAFNALIDALAVNRALGTEWGSHPRVRSDKPMMLDK